jgi:23S rRNA (uridine2552-2'-O)-methyltransferase
LRARSAYKLQEINEQYKIIRPNQIIVDLGAAPGSWTEYVAKILTNTGKIIALDILPIAPIKQFTNITYLQEDFFKLETVDKLLTSLGGRVVDVVLSDMAPNLSGLSDVDSERFVLLLTNAIDFVSKVLKPNGTFFAKAWQDQNLVSIAKKLRFYFHDVKIIKPKSSRSRSREVFLLARGFNDKA